MLAAPGRGVLPPIEEGRGVLPPIEDIAAPEREVLALVDNVAAGNVAAGNVAAENVAADDVAAVAADDIAAAPDIKVRDVAAP